MDARVRIKFEITAGGMKSRRARHRVATEDCNARDRMRSYEISRDRMRSEATALYRTLPHSTALYRTLPHGTALYRTLPHSTAQDRTLPHGTARGTANDRKALKPRTMRIKNNICVNNPEIVKTSFLACTRHCRRLTDESRIQRVMQDTHARRAVAIKVRSPRACHSRHAHAAPAQLS